MSLPIPRDTLGALGPNLDRCDSRSLRFDRFADPELKEEHRRGQFERAIEKKALPEKVDAWHQLAEVMVTQGRWSQQLAQLQARLMVNMGGGVMENAGLCLDRFGVPWIPGTAVKGCARRTVLATLKAWVHSGTRPDPQLDPLAPVTEGFESPLALLQAFLRVFGCTEEGADLTLDKQGYPRSDIVEALGPNADTLLAEAAQDLPATARKLPNLSGTVGFLPAYPLNPSSLPLPPNSPLGRLPALGDLELDVVTCHHRNYYSGTAGFEHAPDTEEPNPVVFPAVAPGHVFRFCLVPLRAATQADLTHANRWLATGLAVLGIGAKTNAGYGWFNTGPEVTAALEAARHAQAEKQRVKKQQEETAKRQAEEDQRRAEQRKRDAEAMASMTPDQQADYALAQLNDDQFRTRLNDFGKRDEAEQKAIIRALRLETDATGSRRKFWDDLKERAEKKGRDWAQRADLIRTLSKRMYPGKEGKMP